MAAAQVGRSVCHAPPGPRTVSHAGWDTTFSVLLSGPSLWCHARPGPRTVSHTGWDTAFSGVLRSPQRPIPPSAASGRAGLPGAHLAANSCASRSGNCPGPENRPARQSPVVITAAASPGAPPAGRREPRIGSPNLHAGLGDCPCPGPRVYPGCFIRGAGLPAGPAVSSVGTRRSVHPPLPLLPCDSQPG